MIGSLVESHLSIWPFIKWFFIAWAVENATFLMIFNHKRRWIKRAHRLAAQSNIELPTRLEDRVARRLRNEFLVSMALFPLMYLPVWIFSLRIGLRNAEYWTTWIPRLTVLLPLLVVCYGFASVVVARWNSPGTTRVSHFRQIRLREAFTPTESLTLVAGACATLGVSVWGLSRVHAGMSWWILDLVAVVTAGVLWWRMELAFMRRPSMASDATELGWDDVLRFRRVRSLAISAAWLPPFVIFCLDFYFDQSTTHFSHVNMLPIYVPIASVVGVVLIFREGRQLWRLEGR
jgi:hypothetical protein